MKIVTSISRVIVVCLLLGSALLQGEEALFVFQAGQPAARVYDARDFQLLARPVVAADSFHAVAASGANPLRARKFYVAGRDSVTVLDGNFSNAGVIRFGEELPREPQAVAVTGNGERLLVAAGTKVYIVDTAGDTILATLDTGLRLRGILISADGSQAFAFSSESAIVRIVDIKASRLLNAAITLPQIPTALSAGPGGGMFASSENGIYDLAPIAQPRFQTQPMLSRGKPAASTNGPLTGNLPAGTGGTSFGGLVVAANRRFFASTNGRLVAGTLGTPGGLNGVLDRASELPIDHIGTIAPAMDGKSIYAVAEGERQLMEIDSATAERVREIALDYSPVSIAAVTTVVEQGAFAFQIVSGNNQTVAPNTDFQLSVKAINNEGGPVAGETIFLEAQIPSVPDVECDTDVTGADGIGTITCSADETAEQTPLILRVAGLSFNVTVSPTGMAGGALIKISPDFLVIGQGKGFAVVIEAQDANATPQQGISLTITVNLGNAFVTCPDKAITGSDGRASIACATGFFATQQTLIITWTDTFGRTAIYTYLLSPVSITIGLQKVEGDFQTVPQNSPFNMTVQANDLTGNPRSNFQLAISHTPDSPTLSCPASVMTNSSGAATFTCNTGTVSVQTAALITVSDGQTSVTFTATLQPGTTTAPWLSKVSGDNQTVLKNSPFLIVVQSNDGSGVPRGSATLLVSTNVSSSTATCPTQVQTNLDGRATISCTAGNVTSSSNVQVSVNDNLGHIVVFTVTILPATTTGEGFRKVSGDNQVTIPNVALQQPLVVESRLNGIPQTNAVFTVTTSPSNRLLCSSTVNADSLGRGSIFCSAGSASELTIVRVFVTDNLGRSLDSPFTVTIFPGSGTPPDVLTLITTSSFSGAAGATLENAVAVRATKADTTVMPGTLIAFRTSQDATFSPPADVTDNDGVARTSVTLGCSSGSIRVSSPFGGPEVMVSYSVTAGAPGAMTKVQGDNQSGIPGQLLNQVALVVRLTDICGSPSSRVPVGWSVEPPDSATLVNTIGVTDGNGRSSTLVRLGNRPGPFMVTATSGTLSVSFNLTVNAAASRLLKISGDSQTASVGQAFANPLVVEVQNDAGAKIPGVQVQFTLLSGSASIGTATATSDAQGRASTTVTAGNSLGAVSIRASGAGQTQTFNLSVRGRAPSVPVGGFVNYASFRPGWVPGSGGAIFGTGMMEGIDGVVTAPGIPFPTTFRGVRVLVNGVPAPIIHLININGAEQINVQVPFQTQAGTATVVIENNGSSTTITGVPILPVQPGIFMNFTNGFAAALHISDFSLVTAANPARPNELIALFLTGLGLVNPAVATNAPGPVPPAVPLANVVVGIDDAGMETLGAFYAPGLITAFQINFRVGANVQSGNRKLAVVADGVAAVDAVLPVQR